MKLKTRIILGFTMIILMPLLLFAATLYGFSQSQAQKAQAVTESDGTVYDISITDSADSQGRVHVMAKDLFISAFVILISVALVVGLWVYRSIAVPLVKLKKATQNIKEGNLDFVLDVEGKDEFSELCQDFEEMRRRLKESTEEKSLIEKENRELISNISHDLKTPITAVKGYVEGIMDGVADTPEKMDRYVRTIYNKTNEMDHLINELTFYSKIDTNRIPYTFSKLNVEDYFEDCSEEVGLELETRGIELVYANYVEKDVMVIADGEQIRRVIHNIISNAIKYNRPNGRIDTYTKGLSYENGTVWYEFTISDTGVGMSEAFVKNELFRPFTQEKSDARTQYKGTGLGMSIVKELLNKLDGSIQVSSTLGQGTTFAFRLPFAVDTQDEETQALISTDKSCKLAGVQVLLVEDNEINMEIAEFYLTERGAAVAKAWNGREAVEKVKAEPRRFDVVLMDVMMPVLDGLAATREIRALPYPAAGVPILAMTAQDTREAEQECKDAGMNDYLAKPVDPDRMAEKILHWTRQQAETSSPAQPAAT